MKLDALAKRIANHLVAKEIEIKFDKIIDDFYFGFDIYICKY